MTRLTPVNPSPAPALHITAYFDFMCPWSYLGRARLLHALRNTRTDYTIDWVPFELYTHNKDHRVSAEKIIGHTHLRETYNELHALGQRENILIYHPNYEASSKRALTGYLYAVQHGIGEKYLDELFQLAFEHTMDISSFAVLRRAALKLHLNPEEFLQFIQDEKNHTKIEEYTRNAKLNGIRGVPAYYINHFPVTGALPASDFEHIIRTTMKKITPAYLLPEKKQKQLPRRIRTKTSAAKKKKPRVSSSKKPASHAKKQGKRGKKH